MSGKAGAGRLGEGPDAGGATDAGRDIAGGDQPILGEALELLAHGLAADAEALAEIGGGGGAMHLEEHEDALAGAARRPGRLLHGVA